jgi:hypothetical protein
MTPFTDDQLSQAIRIYLAMWLDLSPDNRITRNQYTREITEEVLTLVYGGAYETWPAGWEQTWDAAEKAIAEKRIRISVTFEDKP